MKVNNSFVFYVFVGRNLSLGFFPFWLTSLVLHAIVKEMRKIRFCQKGGVI